MYGVKWFTAIINPPEAAILAVGAVEDRLVLGNSGVTAVPSLTLTLSCDHRAIDGQLAARFLRALKARLESAGAWQTPSRKEAETPDETL
jgi:pyruvate dehydrogenase E2 component (dihydrolipoamide acetyltransferase)